MTDDFLDEAVDGEGGAVLSDADEGEAAEIIEPIMEALGDGGVVAVEDEEGDGIGSEPCEGLEKGRAFLCKVFEGTEPCGEDAFRIGGEGGVIPCEDAGLVGGE